MAKTKLPLKPDHTIDFSYFAPDCFHFSGKGHSQAALSLWNNMLEPVGAKQWAWHMGENLSCPTDQFPYIFTNKNSPAYLEEFKRVKALQTTTRSSLDTSTQTTSSAGSSTEKHKHKKHHKSDEYDNMHVAAVAGFFFLLLMLLIVAVGRRQQIRVFVNGGRANMKGFTNPQYPGNDEDVEIWNRSNVKSGFSVNDDLPQTHGTRISLD
jgi:hypothetical protein